MKVLLITSNSNTIVPPFGQYLISAYYQENFSYKNIQILIKFFESNESFKIMKLIAAEKPDILGLGCYIWNIQAMMLLCESIKKLYPEMLILLGGPSISFTEEKLVNLIERDKADYFIVGEGERTFADLLNYLFDGQIHKVSEIPGLMGKNINGQIFANDRPKEYLMDLDNLPNIYMNYPQLVDETKNYGFASLEMSRGCPFKCAYCMAGQSTFQPSLKKRDLNKIINDIVYLRDIGLNKIIIIDPTFNFDIERCKEILRRIISLESDFEFLCEIKVELLDEEIIGLMLEAGFKSIEIGLQTSNIETLKRISRYHDRDKFKKNVERLKNTNLFMVVDLIIGLPGETLEDFYNSLDFCYNLGNVKISCGLLKLYPNTSLYNEREKYKYEYDSERMNRVVKSETMTTEEVDFAESMINPIKVFWSYSECDECLRSYVREVCKKYYNNKFSKFISAMAIFLTDKGILNNSVLFKIPLDKKKLLLDSFIDEQFTF